MNFYDNYLNTIKAAIDKEQLQKSFSSRNLDSGNTVAQGKILLEGLDPSSEMLPTASLRPLGDLMNAKPTLEVKIGEHPDFIHLKGTKNSEFHYITSVFIDIKGSTNLHKKHNLETIYTITNTIQAAAIHTCVMFGGHIQRLQGDGVFSYFGGKSITKEEAVEKSIQASSFFTYFVKYDLPNVFQHDGVERISTRIGIDFGDDNKVMWASFGLGTCCELTTNSLHTSLACKMQAQASANGIVVGEYVKQRLTLPEELFPLVSDSTGKTEYYIFEDEKKPFRYRQYRFAWYEYLKNLPFIKSDNEGRLYLGSTESIEDEKLKKLRGTAALINSGDAYTDRAGNITSNPAGIKNQKHKFHYEA